jgi:hypothetical protein
VNDQNDKIGKNLSPLILHNFANLRGQKVKYLTK